MPAASMIRRCASGISLLALALAGCGSGDTETGGSAGPNPTTTTSPAQAPPADTADRAVLAVIAGLRDKHPEALWDFLPPRQQRDVSELVHEFARRMDDELWSQTIQTLRKLADALGAQLKRLPPDSAAPDWEGLASLLRTLVESDLADLRRLQRADVRQLLATTGGRLFGQLEFFSVLAYDDPFAARLDELSQLQITLQSTTGDSAVVRIDSPQQGPQATEFVRVDGHWIPQALSDGWIEAMGLARAWLSLLSPETLAPAKARWLALLKTLDAAVNRLSAEKDPAQFESSLAAVRFAFAPLAGMLNGALPDATIEEPLDPDEPPAAVDIATLVVEGRFDDSRLAELDDRLQAVLPDRPFFEQTSSDDLASFKIGPIPDVAAFARQLDFLEVVSVNIAQRTIAARLREK
ncbi:MAG: hypothetical protein ACT4QC_12390 [Planctomycetaceae bacterium]